MDGVFVGSGIFKSGDPAKRARAIVQAVTHYNDPAVLAEVRSWAAGAAALACLPGEGQEGGGRRALGCLWPSLPALVLPSCSLLLLRRPYQFPVTLSPPPPPPPPPAQVSCDLGEPMVGIDVREKGFKSYAQRSE